MSMTMPGENAARQVCIVGAGAHTSLGTSLPASCSALHAGFDAFREHPFLIDKTGEHPVVARIPHLDEAADAAARLAELATPAAEEALAPLLGISPAPVISIFGALPGERPGFTVSDSQEVRKRLLDTLNKHYPMKAMEVVIGENTAGMEAFAKGFREIAPGKAEFCLVGGADSYLHPETLEWLDYHDRLHSRTNRWGIIPGEGAAFCLLASAEAVGKYNLESVGAVVGVGEANDEPAYREEDIRTGKGLSSAVGKVLETLPEEEKIDRTICDLTGEIWRADDFGFTVTRLSDRFIDPSRVMAPASAWGDTGVASAPLSVGVAMHAGLRGYASGPYTLVCTSSASGERVALLLHIPVKERK
jgi:3-oxoacyl-[acyl-carrier-protein] synthase-1